MVGVLAVGRGVLAYRRGGAAARRVGRNRSSEGRICEPGVTACERPSKCPSKDHARKVRFVKTWSEVGTGSKAEAHLSMHYYGGIRFPRASFLSYYETWLPPSQNSHTNRSLRRPRSAVTRQRWDSRLTDPAFAGSVSPLPRVITPARTLYADTPKRFDL